MIKDWTRYKTKVILEKDKIETGENIVINKEFSKEEIEKLILEDKIIGQGTYGLVTQYDKDTLFKLYYKDIFLTYSSKNIENLDKEIENNIEIEQTMKDISKAFKTRVESITENIEQLKNTKSNDLIKGVATYKGYLIGVFLKYYREYVKLKDIFNQLNDKDKMLVMNKVSELIDDLYKNGVCPRDVKEDNIMVRINDLDIKLIDLDDRETRFDTYEYFEKKPHIKHGLVESYKKMLYRIKNEKEEERE